MNGLLARNALTRVLRQSDDGALDPSPSMRFPPMLEEDYLDDLKPMALWGMRTWLTVSFVPCTTMSRGTAARSSP